MSYLSKSSCALASADQRLCDGLNLLVETKENYFEPDRFRISLNNTIQTLRNVTFVLQKAKSAFPKFDDWYTKWQETMRSDALVKWLVTARNIIVKQGDLETHSVARISIVESWFEPTKFEVEVPPFTRTEEFARLLSRQAPEGIICDVGLLRVERRWVHDHLPENEILDSLSHSFNVLSMLLFDAHNVLLDQHNRENCPWFRVVEKAKASLPPCLLAQDWDRTIWVDLHDGAVMTPVIIQMKQSEEDMRRASDRYPGVKDLKRKLSATSSLKGEADVLFEQAKNILKTDGYHVPTAFIGYPDGSKTISHLVMEDRTEKHLIMRKLATEIEKTGADSLILINEAWISRGIKPNQYKQPMDDPNREEVLILIATDAYGSLFVHTTIFIRDAEEKIHFNEGERPTIDVVNLLQPIRDVWKRRRDRPEQKI